MAERENIDCATCGVNYEAFLPQCPNCGEANPITTESLFSDYSEPEPVLETPRSSNRSGCLIAFLFFIFIAIVVGSGIIGGYEGLQERLVNTQAEVEKHYQQALLHIEDERLELAKAELELTLTLDPAHNRARDMLATLKSTPTAETLRLEPSTATNTGTNLLPLLNEAKQQTQQGNWSKAINKLEQIREADATFEAAEISDFLYNANYELGLRLVSERRLTEAIAAFAAALVERPDDEIVTAEWEKVTLYLSLNTPRPADFENNVRVLERIYEQDPAFVDVEDLLYDNYKQWGDYLGSQGEWCEATERYTAARAVFSNPQIGELLAQADQQCNKLTQPSPTPTKKSTATPKPIATPTRTAPTATRPRPTATPTELPRLAGAIYFSTFNVKENLWEIVRYNFADNTITSVVKNGTQPDINETGNLLVYHSEAGDSVGLHVQNLSTGVDTRATTFAEDILPSWRQGQFDFVFASQRDGDRRWRVFIGFADGKGDAVFLLDGRTSASSTLTDLIAYAGTDPSGNQPGIYLTSQSGGENRRITTHQSDRNPDISPANNRIAYMSTQTGSWDIWVVDPETGSTTQLTTHAASDGLPTWSPNGRQIAFVSDRGGSWGIYVMDANGNNVEKVADWGNHPDWLLEQISWGP